MKFALKLSYLGTSYHGWQRQKNSVTIQQKIEEAIEKTCGARVSLSGCGRTDAGVHAMAYVASCSFDCRIPLDRLPHALNARLPEDIVVHEAVAVPDTFDARFSCLSKEYTYRIHNNPTRDPFLRDRAWFYPQALEINRMAEAARLFEGIHDFSAVRSVGAPTRSPIREIYRCEVTKHGDQIFIAVKANGFLYNMVRAIAGTLVFVGNGKIDPSAITDILISRDREAAGPTAPPCGLYLTALDYGMEEVNVSKHFNHP